MSFARKPNLYFNAGRDEAIWVLRAGELTGIGVGDRQALSEWLDGSSGIDTVLDLAVRPWNIPGANAIFGVFELNKDRASWLIVRYGSGWTLARCDDGSISDVLDSLADVLGLLDLQRHG